MMTMKQSVDRLVEEDVVSEDVAKSVLVNYGG